MAKEKPEPEDFFGIENIPDLGDSSSNTPPPSSDNEPSLQELFVEKLLKHDQLPLTSRSPSERAKILKKRGNNPPKESEATHQNTVPLPFGHMRFDSDNEPSTGNINEQEANSIENVPKPKKSFEYRRIVPDDEVSVDEDQPTSDIAKRRVTSPNLEPVDEEAEDEIFDRRPSIQKQLPILTPRLNELNDEEILDNLENEIEHKRKLFAGRKETGSLAKINKPIKDMSTLEEGDTSDGEEISAYEEVIRMREEKERQNIQRLSSADRDGSLLALHKLWSLIPDLNKLTREEILDLLVENVLYNESK
uniref:Uncharacterized protein n=1 Tax=Romanomermis culicivorax TaxID=13658 RepID=A0A915KMQ5_ROMCU